MDVLFFFLALIFSVVGHVLRAILIEKIRTSSEETYRSIGAPRRLMSIILEDNFPWLVSKKTDEKIKKIDSDGKMTRLLLLVRTCYGAGFFSGITFFVLIVIGIVNHS